MGAGYDPIVRTYARPLYSGYAVDVVMRGDELGDDGGDLLRENGQEPAHVVRLPLTVEIHPNAVTATALAWSPGGPRGGRRGAGGERARVERRRIRGWSKPPPSYTHTPRIVRGAQPPTPSTRASVP